MMNANLIMAYVARAKLTIAHAVMAKMTRRYNNMASTLSMGVYQKITSVLDRT